MYRSFSLVFRFSHASFIFSALAIAVFLTAAGCRKGEDGPKNTAYVSASSGLVMRSGPGTKQTRIMSIPPGKPVEVLDANGPEEQIEGKKAHWTKVRYANQEGWVFGGFLSGQKPQSVRERAIGYWKGKWKCNDQESHLEIRADGSYAGWLFAGAEIGGCGGSPIQGSWEVSGENICLKKDAAIACYWVENGKLVSDRPHGAFKENFENEMMTGLEKK